MKDVRVRVSPSAPKNLIRKRSAKVCQALTDQADHFLRLAPNVSYLCRKPDDPN
ncbi:hypothetical protein [Leptolyngbya sp. 7M]|uniref:hypothetical protein n=1 Tax=Leptolyngbya sp. 7M TaxID=2812896 RepID=UPI001B8D922F|nr:hypothetical protein [Leptolyngbya sp. 7M]QYO67337.1 hypothetical protein JVX88_11345 [Leptolyngbya sp. 7M]